MKKMMNTAWDTASFSRNISRRERKRGLVYTIFDRTQWIVFLECNNKMAFVLRLSYANANQKQKHQKHIHDVSLISHSNYRNFESALIILRFFCFSSLNCWKIIAIQTPNKNFLDLSFLFAIWFSNSVEKSKIDFAFIRSNFARIFLAIHFVAHTFQTWTFVSNQSNFPFFFNANLQKLINEIGIWMEKTDFIPRIVCMN